MWQIGAIVFLIVVGLAIVLTPYIWYGIQADEWAKEKQRLLVALDLALRQRDAVVTEAAYLRKRIPQ